MLPKHYWEGRTFDQTTLEPPLGSGPYRIARVDPGRSITYERVSDYWGRDLAVNTGRFNFGTMRYDYYLDPTVALQAFNGGLVDFRVENIAKNWATAYDRQAVEAGRIRKEEIEVETPAGMQGFVFNTRRPVFADPRVRYAIAHAFDFEWANSVLFYGAYQRADSYFENSDLESEACPASGNEAPGTAARPYPGRGLHGTIQPAVSRKPDRRAREPAEGPRASGGGRVGGPGRSSGQCGDRAAAGVHDPSQQPLDGAGGAAVRREPAPIGDRRPRADRGHRTVPEPDQRLRFRHDHRRLGQSLSPGNEQRDFWTSAAADRPGSRNYAGIRSEAVDQLVDLLIAADTREDLRARAAALDRVLLWGHYVIPHWYAGVARVAYWEKLEHPRDLPPYGIAFDAWWVKGASAGR